MRSKFVLCLLFAAYSEKVVLNQMVLEKNLTNFRRKMNKLQSNSVIKKTPKEKLEMYKEKKKQEEEQKQKAEEDKKLNKQ